PTVSVLLGPSNSHSSPGHLLCSVMDFFPAKIQARGSLSMIVFLTTQFQGHRELSGHMVASDVVPNGDWTHQLLGLMETLPARGHLSCQVEHVSLEQPLSQ
ncbi:DQB2 protein, partial [Hylia prasina]|nr:DQB2 protein [Hylia prasina]